jgi:hypothetical protein
VEHTARSGVDLRLFFFPHSKLAGTGVAGSGAAFQGWSVALSAEGNTVIVGGTADNYKRQPGSSLAAEVSGASKVRS